MNFFEHQRLAKKKTTLLVTYFFLAVLFIILALFFVFSVISGASEFNSELLFLVALCTITVIGIGSLYKIFRLRSGGHVVAESLGGHRISPDTNNPTERKILNVVEEMAIASGMPVPPVFLLEESGINAFAAGYTIDNAVIGVTRGCIELLTRDELQGVIAHEFSHILHGDMRLNIRLMGILNGILIIGMTGYFILRSSLFRRRGYRSSNDSKNQSGILLIGLALYVIGYIGVFFGRLIKAAISRQREFLADASAVQYTRNPDGIGGALKKIGGYASGSKVMHSHAEEASHLFFSPAISFFFNLMATHPPLTERIQKIDRNFTGTFPEVSAPIPSEQPHIAGFAPGASGTTPSLSSDTLVEQIGTFSAKGIQTAAEYIAFIPEELKSAARKSETAQYVIYALMLSKNKVVRGQQYALLQAHEAKVDQLESLTNLVLDLPEQLFLPLIDLTLPALKTLPEKSSDTFQRILQALAKADKEITLFEYMLHHVFLHHLKGAKQTSSDSLSDRAFYHQALIVLHCVADVGHSEQISKDRALNEACHVLYDGKLGTHLTTREYGLDEFDAALTKLLGARIEKKKLLIESVMKAIESDGKYTPQEFQILRAICDALGCPVPLIIS